MDASFRRAVRNIARFGDTDVLPRPFEAFIFMDNEEAIVELLKQIHVEFDTLISSETPSPEFFLSPVGYTGYRWVSQIDPIWNAYLLGLAIELGVKIEARRPDLREKTVFSYRWNPDTSSHHLFLKELNYASFYKHVVSKARECKFVAQLDIADFYGRVRHHRLETALAYADDTTDLPSRVIRILASFTDSYSHGLPVGGPAARILSECLLSQVDRILKLKGLSFCRFSDDYFLFSQSESEAVRSVILLTETMFFNEGLTIQKSKARIMSSAEFLETVPRHFIDEDEPENKDEEVPDESLSHDPRAFMKLSLRYDPYSATAAEDYEALKEQLSKFDILGILGRELLKSRVDISLSRKLIGALTHLPKAQKDDAALSLVGNLDLLLPVLPNVLIALDGLMNDLSPDVQHKVIEELCGELERGGHIRNLSALLAFAIRVVSARPTATSSVVLAEIYSKENNPIIRRDVILAMARLSERAWISERRQEFGSMRSWERRGLTIASYILGEEGRHWRRIVKGSLSPLEVVVKDWYSKRVGSGNRSVPL